jgi:hypothetical protein
MNIDAFVHILPMVLYGMGGIFVVTIVICAVVMLLNKVFAPKRDKA